MTAATFRAHGTHRRPPARRRALAAARAHRYSLARNTVVTATGLAITATFLLAAAHPRHVQQTPHCLRARNCACREIGGFMPGQNRCRDLPAAEGKESGR